MWVKLGIEEGRRGAGGAGRGVRGVACLADGLELIDYVDLTHSVVDLVAYFRAKEGG